MKKIIAFTLGMSLCHLAVSADYRPQLEGKRLFMKDAYCAGMSLGKVPGFYAEMDCGIFPGKEHRPDLSEVPREPISPASVKWLSGDTFYIVQRHILDEGDSNKKYVPNLYLFNVKALKGDSVTLTSVWTGWNGASTDDTEYWIRTDQKQFINDKNTSPDAEN